MMLSGQDKSDLRLPQGAHNVVEKIFAHRLSADSFNNKAEHHEA
jgi:hypothetical protein